MKRIHVGFMVLAGVLAGCLNRPPTAVSKLEPGWRQSEMLVMSFSLKGVRDAAALEGLAATIREVKPRYVALQDLTKVQADELAARLGMRADYCASGKNADGSDGVAVLSKGEPVMHVFTSQTAMKLPWMAKNPPKCYPRAAISVQFGEHEIASGWFADGAGESAQRIEGLKVYKEVCNQHRPAVMSFDMGVEKGKDAVWPFYGKLFNTISPLDDKSGNVIATRWTFASQFGLDWSKTVPVKGFNGRSAALVNIKY